MSQNKIKVSYIISSLTKQGPVQVLYDIIENLDFDVFDVSVITLSKEGPNSIEEKFRKLPIKIFKVENKSRYNLYSYYTIISRYIKKEKTDIIHSHCFRSLIIARFLKKYSKTFHTIHNYPGLQFSAMKGRYMGGLMSSITNYYIKKIDYPIACSSSVSDDLKIKDNINVDFITNGICYSPIIDKTKDDIRNNLNFDSNIKYFVTLGRFSPEKNFKVLVKAFINANLKNSKLIILGEGKTFDEVKSISDNRILLPGFKSNVHEYLAASDFYISTSLTEGMPLSVLEAMSFGLPLLLSNIPSHKEIFEHAKGKEIGVLFPSNDLPAIENGIKSILKFDYNEMHQNTISVFNDSFTSERMSNEYQEFYIKA